MNIPTEEQITEINKMTFIPVSVKPYPKGDDFIGLRYTDETGGPDGLDNIQICFDDGYGNAGLKEWVTHWFPCPNLDMFND